MKHVGSEVPDVLHTLYSVAALNLGKFNVLLAIEQASFELHLN